MQPQCFDALRWVPDEDIAALWKQIDFIHGAARADFEKGLEKNGTSLHHLAFSRRGKWNGFYMVQWNEEEIQWVLYKVKPPAPKLLARDGRVGRSVTISSPPVSEEETTLFVWDQGPGALQPSSLLPSEIPALPCEEEIDWMVKLGPVLSLQVHCLVAPIALRLSRSTGMMIDYKEIQDLSASWSAHSPQRNPARPRTSLLYTLFGPVGVSLQLREGKRLFLVLRSEVHAKEFARLVNSTITLSPTWTERSRIAPSVVSPRNSATDSALREDKKDYLRDPQKWRLKASKPFFLKSKSKSSFSSSSSNTRENTKSSKSFKSNPRTPPKGALRFRWCGCGDAAFHRVYFLPSRSKNPTIGRETRIYLSRSRHQWWQKVKFTLGFSSATATRMDLHEALLHVVANDNSFRIEFPGKGNALNRTAEVIAPSVERRKEWLEWLAERGARVVPSIFADDSLNGNNTVATQNTKENLPEDQIDHHSKDNSEGSDSEKKEEEQDTQIKQEHRHSISAGSNRLTTMRENDNSGGDEMVESHLLLSSAALGTSSIQTNLTEPIPFAGSSSSSSSRVTVKLIKKRNHRRTHHKNTRESRYPLDAAKKFVSPTTNRKNYNERRKAETTLSYDGSSELYSVSTSGSTTATHDTMSNDDSVETLGEKESLPRSKKLAVFHAESNSSKLRQPAPDPSHYRGRQAAVAARRSSVALTDSDSDNNEDDAGNDFYVDQEGLPADQWTREQRYSCRKGANKRIPHESVSSLPVSRRHRPTAFTSASTSSSCWRSCTGSHSASSCVSDDEDTCTDVYRSAKDVYPSPVSSSTRPHTTANHEKPPLQPTTLLFAAPQPRSTGITGSSALVSGTRWCSPSLSAPVVASTCLPGTVRDRTEEQSKSKLFTPSPLGSRKERDGKNEKPSHFSPPSKERSDNDEETGQEKHGSSLGAPTTRGEYTGGRARRAWLDSPTTQSRSSSASSSDASSLSSYAFQRIATTTRSMNSRVLPKSSAHPPLRVTSVYLDDTSDYSVLGSSQVEEDPLWTEEEAWCPEANLPASAESTPPASERHQADANAPLFPILPRKPVEVQTRVAPEHLPDDMPCPSCAGGIEAAAAWEHTVAYLLEHHDLHKAQQKNEEPPETSENQAGLESEQNRCDAPGASSSAVMSSESEMAVFHRQDHVFVRSTGHLSASAATSSSSASSSSSSSPSSCAKVPPTQQSSLLPLPTVAHRHSCSSHHCSSTVCSSSSEEESRLGSPPSVAETDPLEEYDEEREAERVEEGRAKRREMTKEEEEEEEEEERWKRNRGSSLLDGQERQEEQALAPFMRSGTLAPMPKTIMETEVSRTAMLEDYYEDVVFGEDATPSMPTPHPNAVPSECQRSCYSNDSRSSSSSKPRSTDSGEMRFCRTPAILPIHRSSSELEKQKSDGDDDRETYVISRPSAPPRLATVPKDSSDPLGVEVVAVQAKPSSKTENPAKSTIPLLNAAPSVVQVNDDELEPAVRADLELIFAPPALSDTSLSSRFASASLVTHEGALTSPPPSIHLEWVLHAIPEPVEEMHGSISNPPGLTEETAGDVPRTASEPRVMEPAIEADWSLVFSVPLADVELTHHCCQQPCSVLVPELEFVCSPGMGSAALEAESHRSELAVADSAPPSLPNDVEITPHHRRRDVDDDAAPQEKEGLTVPAFLVNPSRAPKMHLPAVSSRPLLTPPKPAARDPQRLLQQQQILDQLVAGSPASAVSSKDALKNPNFHSVGQENRFPRFNVAASSSSPLMAKTRGVAKSSKVSGLSSRKNVNQV